MKRFLTFGTSLLALVVASAAHADPSWNFGVTQSIETFVAPTTGTYDITAVGAQGTGARGNAGGLGADISVRLALTAGEQLSIAVGMYRSGYTYNSAFWPEGGGGGGSFVVAPGNQPLLIAGGGGGANNYKGGYNASLTRAANQGNGLGQGGSGLSGKKSGGGGGGFFTSGGGGNGYDGFDGGGSWLQGASGGLIDTFSDCCWSGFGGFGGGGGGYATDWGGYGLGGAGGGGGYSGGNGGLSSRYYNGGTGGGGGGSYIPTGATVLSAGLNYAGGSGYVTITQDQATSTDVPEPASAALLGLGAAALAAQRRRKR